MEKQTIRLFVGNEIDFYVHTDNIKSCTERDIYIVFDGDEYDPHTGECLTDDCRSDLQEYEEAWDESQSYYYSAKATLETMKHMAGGSIESPKPAATAPSGRLESLIADVVASEASEDIFKKVYPLVEGRIFERFGFMPERHEVVMPNKKVNTVDETTHEVFDKVLKLVGADCPCFLQGPAGTGKNVICKQVAKALDLDFYFTNAVTQEYQLKGFIDANGHFHETQFYKAFTQGGLFFLDEMDASVPETLIILNSAIANRYFDFPTGRVEANPDFRVIAAGNTVGTGATIEYSGRFQLDAASLDRFALIYVDYSPRIEMNVARGDEELCKFARSFREATQSCGIKCLFTYRSIDRIASLKSIDDDLADILHISLTKGMRRDDVHILNAELRRKGLDNEYTKALLVLEERL